ncbi:S41 family peptidase (plasmid) [Pseudalkalibacillus hwajinpoensis]|uniref:S41 family peptidase n=1 Tax=Guptibacillus hwajinpoensis TaxID=208199 RepID=UPI00325B186C
MNKQINNSMIRKKSDEMYRSVFNEIVDIMHNDYAGYKDKAGWDQPDFYLDQLVNIDDNGFIDLVQDYLLDFKDLHTGFNHNHNHKQKQDIGFTVRRFEDHLYITSSRKEERLKTGDKILALDGSGISEIAKKYEKKLQTVIHERQKWDSVMFQFQEAEIETKQGHKRILELSTYEPIPNDPEYSIQELEKDILYMKLTDFMNHDSISQLICNNEDRLSTYSYLIIDVRVNKGGSDLAYFDLLPYVFNGEKVDIRNFSNEIALTNCTERNVSLRLQMLQGALASIEDKETRHQIHIMIEELENHRGEGFVELNLSELEEDLIFETKPGPKKVIILSDVYCGSAGDSFVETCKHSSKVTVLGRPTLGMNDYANVAFKEWDNRFKLMYPTSKSSRVDEGKGMSGKGIQPDVYVPWTPLHLEQDVDLEKAIKECFKERI